MYILQAGLSPWQQDQRQWQLQSLYGNKLTSMYENIPQQQQPRQEQQYIQLCWWWEILT